MDSLVSIRDLLQAVRKSPQMFRRYLMIDVDNPEAPGGLPLEHVADPWQRADFAALDPGWARVAGRSIADGCVPKLRGYLERGRGHSKTNDIATMIAWALIASDRKLLLVAAAADKDQARLIRDAIDKLCRLNLWLGELLDVQSHRVVHRETGSTLEILSADADSSYGLTPDAIVIDELTHWSDSAEALWTSLFSAAAKRASCLLTVISNAGTGEGASWQWRVREAARTSSEWYFSRLNGPVASWILPERLAEQERMLPAIAYRRLWLNEWTSGVGDAIAEAEITAALRLEAVPTAAEDGLIYTAGLDLGISRDASALVVVGRERGGDRVKLCHVREWIPGDGRRVSIGDVEAAIVAVNRIFPLVTVAYDPWQAQYLSERLGKSGIPMREVAFAGQNMQAMATAVTEAFHDGRIELFDHAGLLADLRGLRVVEKSYGWRLAANRNKAGHADRAIALSLALLAAKDAKPMQHGVFAWDENEKPPTLEELLGDMMPESVKRQDNWFTRDSLEV